MIGILFLILLVMAMFRSEEYHYPYCNRTRLNDERKQDALWSYSQFERSDDFRLDVGRHGGISMSGSGCIHSKFSLKRWFKQGFKKHFRNKNAKIVAKTAIILASVLVVYQLTGSLLALGLLGAVFTSKADGNWDDEGQTTWNEAGHPGGGDTVTIQNTHTVTLGAGAAACSTLTIDNGGILTDAANNVGLTSNGTTTVNGTLIGGTAAFSFLTLDVNATFTPGVQTVTCNGPDTDFTGATITNGGTTAWTLNFATNNCNFTPLYTDEVTPHFYNITVATDTKTITLLGNLCLENQLDVSACATSGGLASNVAEVAAFTNSNSLQANPLVLHANATLPAAINLNMTNAYNVPASANYNILYVKSFNTQTATATGTITCTYLYVGDHNVGQECTFNINTRTITSTGNCLVGNTTGNTRSGLITVSTGELQVDGNFVSDVNSSGVVPSGAATLDFNGTSTMNGGTVGANVSWVADWEGNITIAGGTLSAPDNSGSFNFAANFSRTSGTFTHNSGTITLDGSVQQDITSGSQIFYHVVLSGAGTLYYMKDDTEMFDCNVAASTTFEIDAISEIIGLELSFTDIASCGFLASDGALVCQGNGSFGVTITTAAAGAPTNYWDGITTMDITADYTTVSYFTIFQSNGTWDVDNCTFDNGATGGVYIKVGSTLTSFDNNTISNIGANNSLALEIEVTASPINNLVITNPGGVDVSATGDVEFTNSNFDISNCWLTNNTCIVSDVHNDVANAYIICMRGNFWKTDITNDITGTDNVTLYHTSGYTGRFLVNEAIAHNNFTIQDGTELEVREGITQTVTQGATMTVESGGTLDYIGLLGSLITIVSSTPTMTWFMDAQAGSTVTVSYVDVQDSDASAGEEIDASDGTCVDSGRNLNWNFGGVGGTGAASSMALGMPFWAGMIFKIMPFVALISSFLYTNNYLLFIGILGAAFTSKTSGDWDVGGQTIWNEIGIPVSGDTVQINNTHTIRIDSGTGNEACLSCDIQAGGILTIDDENVSSVSLTFDDNPNAGFGTSDGTLNCIGTAGNGVILISVNIPPTNYWDFTATMDVTADYTTFSYFGQFDQGNLATLDIDNCTFNNTSGSPAVKLDGIVSSFDDNIVTSSGYYQVTISVSGLIIDNLTVNGTGQIDINNSITGITELTNSSFTFPDGVTCSTNATLISKNHNNVTGAYNIKIHRANLNKSSITNDFGSTDNVTMYRQNIVTSAKFIIDETMTSNDFTIKISTTLNINPGITWTITPGATVTIENGGTLDMTGLLGSLITLVSDTPTNAWNLDAKSGSTVIVSYVDVQDSDASAGEEIDASDGTSVDSGHNINWDFGIPVAGGGGSSLQILSVPFWVG